MHVHWAYLNTLIICFSQDGSIWLQIFLTGCQDYDVWLQVSLTSYQDKDVWLQISLTGCQDYDVWKHISLTCSLYIQDSNLSKPFVMS